MEINDYNRDMVRENNNNSNTKDSNMKELKASENYYGMRVVNTISELSLAALHTGTAYQRNVNKKHVNKLATDMIINGYNPAAIIEVNEDMEVIDGQHRLAAARKAELPHVPVIVLSFPDEIHEAKYFVYRNGSQDNQTPKQLWKSRNASKEPIAMTMYRLVRESDSLLHRCIDLLDSDVTLNSSKKVSGSFVAHALNLMINGDNSAYKEVNAVKINEGITGTSHSEIKEKMNRLFSIIYGCFGSRSVHSAPFKDTPLRSFLSFINLALTQSKLDVDKDIAYLIRKISGMDLSNGWMQGDQAFVVNKYVKGYNLSIHKPENKIVHVYGG